MEVGVILDLGNHYGIQNQRYNNNVSEGDVILKVKELLYS